MIAFRNGNAYYEIMERLDGLIDIVFVAPATAYKTDTGVEYDERQEYTIPAVTRYSGIEDDIRSNYYAWHAHAEALTREITAIHDGVDGLIDAALRHIKSGYSYGNDQT